MRFTTETGSIYQIDEANKLICRLTGKLPPTERQTEGWREYDSLFPEVPEVGQSVIISWKSPCVPLPETVEMLNLDPKEKIQGSTITSRVVKVEETNPIG